MGYDWRGKNKDCYPHEDVTVSKILLLEICFFLSWKYSLKLHTVLKRGMYYVTNTESTLERKEGL